MGVLMALAPLLQARRILKLKAADEVSVGLFCVITAGAGAYLAYGIDTGAWPLIAANALGVITNGSTLAVTIIYRRRAGSRARASTAPASLR